MMTTVEELPVIFSPAGVFPLGRRFGEPSQTRIEPGRVPFGVSLAIQPRTATVDLSHVGYDTDRQIAVVNDGGILVPLMRHSTGTTKTNTGRDDSRPPDSDSDATED